MADNFNDGKEGTTVSDYKLVDPTTGNKVSSVTTNQGTYTVDPTTGEVTFTPVEGFVGTATPMKVSANVTFNDESRKPSNGSDRKYIYTNCMEFNHQQIKLQENKVKLKHLNQEKIVSLN